MHSNADLQPGRNRGGGTIRGRIIGTRGRVIESTRDFKGQTLPGVISYKHQWIFQKSTDSPPSKKTTKKTKLGMIHRGYGDRAQS